MPAIPPVLTCSFDLLFPRFPIKHKTVIIKQELTVITTVEINPEATPLLLLVADGVITAIVLTVASVDSENEKVTCNN